MITITNLVVEGLNSDHSQDWHRTLCVQLTLVLNSKAVCGFSPESC